MAYSVDLHCCEVYTIAFVQSVKTGECVVIDHVIPSEQYAGTFQGKATQLVVGPKNVFVFVGKGRADGDICWPQTYVARLKGIVPGAIERYIEKMKPVQRVQFEKLAEYEHVTLIELVAVILATELGLDATGAISEVSNQGYLNILEQMVTDPEAWAGMISLSE